MSDWQEDKQHQQGSGVLTESKKKTEKPPLYKILLHNDDYTTMEFVVYILESVFHKSQTNAAAIMLAVHRQGVGVAGVYPHEIAEAKVNKVGQLAKANNFPLLCTMEEE